MHHLRVKTGGLQVVLIAVIGLIFLPLGLGIFLNGIAGGLKVVPIVIGTLMLVTFTSVLFVFLRGHRRSVKYLSEQGLTRNDGREFLWAELSRVVDKMYRRSATRKGIWRTEIKFDDGSSAWLIPSKVANYREVRAFINGLQCEHVEEDA
jgi:hypothetical protein